MKKNVFPRTLAALTLAVCVLLSAVPAGLAETTGTYNVTLDLALKDNMFLANYGVTVYVDDVKLGYLPQGGRLIKIKPLSKGIHTLYFYPEKNTVPAMNMDIYVGAETLFASTLQTHRKYVMVNTLSFRIGTQNAVEYRDLSSDSDDWVNLAALMWQIASSAGSQN